MVREIGTFEVLRQRKAHHPRCAYGDIRVPREVTVYLERKKEGGQGNLHSGVAGVVPVNSIDQYGDAVSYD